MVRKSVSYSLIGLIVVLSGAVVARRVYAQQAVEKRFDQLDQNKDGKVTRDGAGLPEVDGLFVPSIAPSAKSESGTMSALGYWNGRLAWDRADGKAERSPSLSYSNSYKSWRISRLDGHLAYHVTGDTDLPAAFLKAIVFNRQLEVYADHADNVRLQRTV